MTRIETCYEAENIIMTGQWDMGMERGHGGALDLEWSWGDDIGTEIWKRISYANGLLHFYPFPDGMDAAAWGHTLRNMAA